MRHSSFLFLIVMIFYGCRPTYVTNRHNVPLLKEQGDLSVAINPRNLQAAYAVTPNIGVMLNGYYRQRRFEAAGNSGCWFCPFRDEVRHKVHHQQALIEAGAGYFRNHPVNGARFELFGGFGLGPLLLDMTDLNDSLQVRHEFSARQDRFFIQPAFGYSEEKVEIAFSCRITTLRFTRLNFQNFTETQIGQSGFFSLGERDHYTIEPAFTIRFGTEVMKLELQTGYMHVPTYQPSLDPRSYIRPRAFASAAVIMRIGTHRTPATPAD